VRCISPQLHQPLLRCDAAGTPATNATFFCETLSGNCFLLRSGAAVNLGFYQAADLCAAYTGGNLAVYDKRSKQLLVRACLLVATRIAAQAVQWRHVGALVCGASALPDRPCCAQHCWWMYSMSR
jgi:hypothetical protein